MSPVSMPWNWRPRVDTGYELMPTTDAETTRMVPRGQRGSLLLVALLLIVLVAAIAIGAVSLVGSGSATSADRVLGEKALFAAQSGILRIGGGTLACNGASHAVDDGAGFACAPPPVVACGSDDAFSLVRGWAGAGNEDDAPVAHHICVNLDATGGAGPPPECYEADSDWTCAFDDGDVGPGGGPGSDFDNLYVAEDVTIQGGGNRTVEGDTCFADGAEVNGKLTFRGNVYWETEESTSGASSDYESCVYVAGELDEDLSGATGGCDETIDVWCPHGGDGSSGWGYSD